MLLGKAVEITVSGSCAVVTLKGWVPYADGAFSIGGVVCSLMV